MVTPEKAVGRLSLYRRLLMAMKADGAENVFSHQLAAMAGGTAAQVRRDMMVLGFTGSPVRGYDVDQLVDAIGEFLDAPDREAVVLVGIGNLGRAIMAYFAGRRPNMEIVAALDADPAKTGRVIHGCRTHAVDEMEQVIAETGARVAIVTVPGPEAQAVTDALVRSGVTGILNFAPVRLRVPEGVFVEQIDVTMALEKVSFFARPREAVRKV